MGKNNKKKNAKKKAAAAAKKVEQTKSTDTVEEVKSAETTEETNVIDVAPSIETEAATVDEGTKESNGGEDVSGVWLCVGGFFCFV